MSQSTERDQQPERCPYCGSGDLKFKPLPGFLPWECADCGHLFDVDNPNLDAYEDDEDMDYPPGSESEVVDSGD